MADFTSNDTKTADMVGAYIDRGYAVTPLKPGMKEPRDTGHMNTSYGRDDVGATDNVGVKLGQASQNRLDVDIDSPEARLVASAFLPETAAIFGRPSNPRSHFLYEVDGADDFRRMTYTDPDGTLYLEVRGNAHYTMFPPSIHPEGEQVTWHTFGDPGKLTLDRLMKSTGGLAVAAMLGRHWQEWTHRHHMIVLSLAGGLARAGWSRENVLNLVKAICLVGNDDDLQDRLKAVESTFDKYEAGEDTVGFPRLAETIGDAFVKRIVEWLDIPDVTQYPLTDLGNAERFRRDHGTQVRYCADEKRFYVYNSKQWLEDRTGEVFRLARKTVRSIPDEAKRYTGNSEEHTAMRKKIYAWAMQSENQKRLEAMVKLAQHDEAIAVRVDDFDKNPYLLNTPDGTYDLRIGVLRPHDPADLIRRITGASYDPDATSDVLDTFLIAATEGWDVAHGLRTPTPEEAARGKESRDFLQRLAGYSLIGETPEEVAPMLHGPEASGKSTVVAMIKNAMGDYAKTTDFDTFLKRKQPGGIRTDLVRLAGARFVVSIEVDDGKELAEGLFKRLTGGDEQLARGLFTSEIELRPTATYWLVVNDAPIVSASDGGMWRRILRFPFPHTVPYEHRDASVKRTLTDPAIGGPAVLRWLIDGYRAWQINGLMVPDFVHEATEEMRSDMDPVKDFLEDVCVVNPDDPTLTVRIAALWSAYRAWTRQNLPHGRELSRKAFGDALTRRGIVRDKGTGGVRIWRGIALPDVYDGAETTQTGSRTVFGSTSQQTA